MIIQHNIMALNSYNRLGANNGAVSKNLEKLSSGYKINRAGDDAAGLAISEKMRAQITGLDRASQNAQDGISLVQTAEGNLTEVHSMLNRMVDLATQASNGTIDNEVDRKNLQKEVTALKEEIDRISENANFNGIKLLDGSMGTGTTGAVVTSTAVVADGSKGGLNTFTATLTGGEGLTVKFAAAAAGTASSSAALSGNTLTITLTGATSNAAVNTYTKEDMAKLVQNTLAGTTYEGAKLELSDDIVLSGKTGANAGTANDYKTALGTLESAGITSAAAKQATVTNATNGVTVTADKAGVNTKVLKFDGSTQGVSIAANGNVTIGLETGKDYSAADINAMLSKAGAGMSVAFDGTKTAGAGAAAATGTFGNSSYTLANGAGLASGGGLNLQIGDTAEQRVSVQVANMGTAALGLSGVDVSAEDTATSSIKLIKEAINTVSGQRADLGAIQNRLEHTVNNLATTTENMTAAESRIRDTDMAKEMMAFTKNNVLAQAAQAMLAQANQQPQQVLQLLR